MKEEDFKPFESPKYPKDELPKIGQRVRVICSKEMIYQGNDDEETGEWKDDGEGHRFILCWEEI